MKQSQFLRAALPQLYFLSGFGSIICEVIWARKFSLILGGTVYAVTLVTATFMLGIAIGSRWFGRSADSVRSPLKLFACLCAGIGMYSFISPMLCTALLRLNGLIFEHTSGAATGKQLVRFLLAGLVLMPPTLLMGGTFPALLKAYTIRISRSGADAGILNFVNTTGGAAGAFAAGFFLIRTLGVNGSIFFAAMLYSLISAAAAVLARARGYPENKAESPAPQGDFKQTPHPCSSGVRRAVLIAMALSGFCCLAYEILWTKILINFFRDSVYDFALILTVFLTGLGLGNLLFGKIAGPRRRTLILLGLVEASAGLSAIGLLFLISRLPYLADTLHSLPRLHSRFGTHYLYGATSIKFAYASMIMLLPTIFLGGAFPLAGAVIATSKPHLGGDIGRISMIQTIGAVGGSLAVCFVMIEAFGARNSVLIIAGVNICAAILVLAASGLKPVFAGAISITIVGTALIIAVTLPRWDRIRMSASFFDPLDKVEEAIDVLFYKEDAYGVTSVLYARPLAQKFLVTNRNYIQSASSTAGLEDHRRLGHIPLLLHPHPEHVAVIGMGTGVTLRGVAAHNPATIDCAEISAAVFGAAAYFSDENGDVTKNGAINFIIEDGRNFLAFAGKSYDVIVCDVLFPMSAGAGYMFTTDYFKLLKRRLRPGGLACVWVPLSQLPSADVRTIAASFKKEFPHTTLWLGTAGESIPVLGCIGTQTPLRIYYSDLSERLANTRIAAELSQINLDDPSLFLSNFIMGSEGIGKFTENSPLNTDNLPVIEFSTPLLSVDYPAQGAANLNAIICDAHSVVPYLAAFPADDSAADSIIREIELSARARKTLISGIAASMSGHPAAALARFRAVLQQQPESPDASLLIAQLVPSLQHDLLSKGDDLYRQDSQQDALKTYRAIVEADPSTPLAYQAFLRIGTLLLENRKSDEAAAALEEALAHFPSDPRLITLAAEAAGQ